MTRANEAEKCDRCGEIPVIGRCRCQSSPAPSKPEGVNTVTYKELESRPVTDLRMVDKTLTFDELRASFEPGELVRELVELCDAKCAEVERHKDAADLALEMCKTLDATIATLRSQLAEAQRDAGRYRWLRAGPRYVFVFNSDAGRIEGETLDAVCDGGIHGA